MWPLVGLPYSSAPIHTHMATIDEITKLAKKKIDMSLWCSVDSDLKRVAASKGWSDFIVYKHDTLKSNFKRKVPWKD